MGTTTSKPALTEAQQDIKHLGDRYPFGDDEIWRMYNCFQKIQESSNRTSFLSDWAVHCTSLTKEETLRDENGTILKALQEEKSILIQIVENKILPPGFGNKLEMTAFASHKNDADYSNTTIIPAAGNLDTYTRMVRIEKFFDGVSNCGRRGGREALAVLFACCAENHNPPSTDSDGQMVVVANIQDLLNMSYRIALAAAFLNAAKRDDCNMGKFIPVSDNVTNDPAMRALGQSVMAFCKRKRSRDSPLGAVEANDTLEQGWVQKNEFTEWSEANAPLLPSALATFMHCIFFPDTPYPPSRTAFNFPRLPAESTFFNSASSTLLFSFACMASALGGTVSSIIMTLTGTPSEIVSTSITNLISLFSGIACIHPLLMDFHSIGYKMHCWGMADQHC